MSDDRYKKEIELKVMEYFNPIYEIVTDDYLEVVEVSEKPDFISKRKNGEAVGVEITQIRRGHPDDVFFDKYINKNISIHPFETIDMIQICIGEKEKKRKLPEWKLPDKTILIVQLRESPLWEFEHALSENLFSNLPDYGFYEIWLADFSELEAFDNIELYCLSPPKLSGYYKRPTEKPYS